MAVVFEGKRYEKIVFNGVALCKAREAAGLSQAGLAKKLKNVGIVQIGSAKVNQMTVSRMETEESFAVEIPVFRAFKTILGATLVV